MTNEELCLRYQAGDADAAEELISKNMGFIRSIALRYGRDYKNARLDDDDFTQEGAAALLRAASRFDPAQKVRFLSYSRQAIQNAITDAIRVDDPKIKITPSDDSQPGESDANGIWSELSLERMNNQLASPYESDPEHIYIQKEKLGELYAAIHALPFRDHTWVISRYGFDDDIYKSLSEMSRIYHLSERRAKKTEDGAIGKLRKKLKHVS